MSHDARPTSSTIPPARSPRPVTARCLSSAQPLLKGAILAALLAAGGCSSSDEEPLDVAGYWEGTTGSGNPIAFHVSTEQEVVGLALVLSLSYGTAACTAPFFGESTTVENDSFDLDVRAAGISVEPTVHGKFDSPTRAHGSYSASASGFSIACGNSYTVGTGSARASGTFSAERLSTCGDGVVETGEECDGGADCDTACQRIPICGDGFVDSPEPCDDGNDDEADHCNSDCQRLMVELEYSTAFPYRDQQIAGDDFHVYVVQGLTANETYTFEIADATADLDLFVFADPNLEEEICADATTANNQSCAGVVPADRVFLVVSNYSYDTASYTINVTAPT